MRPTIHFRLVGQQSAYVLAVWYACVSLTTFVAIVAARLSLAEGWRLVCTELFLLVVGLQLPFSVLLVFRLVVIRAWVLAVLRHRRQAA